MLDSRLRRISTMSNGIISRQLLFLFILVDTVILQSAGSAVDLKIDEKRQEIHKTDSVNLLIYTCLLCLTIFTLWAFKHKRRLGCLHESGLAVIYGLIIGMIIRFAGTPTEIAHLMVHPVDHFDKSLVLQSPKDSFDSYNWSKSNSKVVKAESIPDTLIIAYNFSPDPPEPNGFAKPTRSTKGVASSNLKLFSYNLGEEYERNEHDESEVQHSATFSAEIFFYVLLPPIIFNAGYSMKRKAFFNNM